YESIGEFCCTGIDKTVAFCDTSRILSSRAEDGPSASGTARYRLLELMARTDLSDHRRAPLVASQTSIRSSSCVKNMAPVGSKTPLSREVSSPGVETVENRLPPPGLPSDQRRPPPRRQMRIMRSSPALATNGRRGSSLMVRTIPSWRKSSILVLGRV